MRTARKEKADAVRRNVLLFALALLYACVPYSGIVTQQVGSIDPNPSYTLILYGGRYSDDIENLAILDPEDDPYKFEIYAPDFDYRVYPHVSAQEALERAEKHVGFHPSFRRSMLSRIPDPQGRTIGYEVRPLYATIDFRYSDVLDVHYQIRDDKVIVRIRLIDEVRRLRDGDGPMILRGRR